MKKTNWSGTGGLPAIDPAKEKRKLILLVVAAVMVGGAYLYSVFQAASMETVDQELVPAAGSEEVVQVVELPAIDADAWRAAVRDETQLERLELKRETLDLAVGVTRRMVPTHYTELGLRTLDSAGVAALLEAPDAERGKAFRARGWIEELVVRQGQTRSPEYHGLLLLEDGAPVYFVALRIQERLSVGEFAVLDGLFLQRFTEESENGWLDGPLLVGAELRRSYPKLENVDRDRIDGLLAFVQDDTAQSGTGRPFEASWNLMAYAADDERIAADVEWENAPELNQGIWKQLMQDPDAYRGMPFEIPVVQVMGLTVLDPGENPMRAERVTEGWLASTTWTGALQFSLPEGSDVVYRSEPNETLAWGRGFFVKKVSYESAKGEVRQAPYFVLTELVEHISPEDKTQQMVAMVVGGLFLTMGVFFAIALRRDKKRSLQLQQDLARRRRERRSKPSSAVTT